MANSLAKSIPPTSANKLILVFLSECGYKLSIPICILTLDSNELYNGKSYGDVLFNIPEKFRPKFRTPVAVGLINSASGGAAHIEPDGNLVWRGSRTLSALYINAVYLAK